jgi:hypothetical protein
MIVTSRLLFIGGLILGAVRLAATDSMDMKGEVLSAYLKVSAALAADDLAAAKIAAATVAEHARMSDRKDIANNADALAQASKIEAARETFRSLTIAMEPLVEGDKGYVVMYCPMAKSDWIQMPGQAQNPYFGKSMLHCGGPKKSM